MRWRTRAFLGVFLTAFMAVTSLVASAGPQSGGVINVVVQPEPPGLMLGLTQNGPTQMVAGNIYESLLRYDDNLDPIANLATSWDISADGTVYTFVLKKGVRWHDGAPFTAHDVVFTVDTFLRKTHPRLRVSLKHIDKIEALGDYKVRFTLKQPFGPFLGIFEVGTMPMVPRHIYEGTDFRNNPANDRPIGTGPFKFKEWVKGSYIHLVRNDEYHVDGLPYIDEIYWHVIPDSSARAIAYETGKVDVLPGGSIENFDVARLRDLPNTDVTQKGWEYFAPHAFLWINNRKPPLSDPRFRRAIMYAMDQKFAKDVIWNGFGTVATGPISSKTRFYSNNVTHYAYDPKKAKALLDEMGYDGSPIRLLPLPYGEAWQRWAEAIRQNLKEVGIEVSLQATDVGGWNQRLNEWDYDLAFTYLYQFGDPALGVARTYISSNIAKGSPWNNVAGYDNPKVDQLFDSAAVAFPQEKRQTLYNELQKTIVGDVPVAWMLELEFPTIYRSNIRNLITTAIGLNDGFVDAWIEN